MTKAENKEIYASFHNHQSEFAISVKFVQEVVLPPNQYTHLPLAPNYLIGLFNLRGEIIPVVDLKKIFQDPQSAATSEQRIAIVDINNCRIGLLFDKTGEIFTSHQDEREEFKDPENNQIISGVFKRNQGDRLVQILNISAVLKLQNVPHGKESARSSQQMLLKSKKGTKKQCISFLVGSSRCALAITEIQEIIKFENLQKSVLSGPQCLGHINLRGTTVPVIDFSAFLGMTGGPENPTSLSESDKRIIVLTLGAGFIGLSVDTVDSIVSYFSEDLVSFPVLQHPRAEMFHGCIISAQGCDTILLNPEKLLSDREVLELTHGHSKLYSDTAKATNQGEQKKNLQRRTYISFLVRDTYAVGIDEVREIIDFPESLISPPGIPEHYAGVLNLRGELVTIVNTRAMYKMTPLEKGPKEKILILRSNGIQFGLVVDAIDAILSFNESDRVKIPDLIYKTQSVGLANDIQEAVTVNTREGVKKDLLVLNVDSMSKRLAVAA